MTNIYDVVVALIWASSVLFVCYGAYRATVPVIERGLTLIEAHHTAGTTGKAAVAAARRDDPMPFDLQMMAARLADGGEHMQWAADQALASLREVYEETGDWDRVRQWAAQNVPGANAVHRVA